MAGRRLLDAALVFNATRGVARQHLQIRAKQVDIWSKSSSLFKALKNQTDRVTLTAQAANALFRRTQEEPYQSAYNTQAQQSTTEERVPRENSVENASKPNVVQEGLEQDHHYDRARDNTTLDPPPDGELSVNQKKPSRYPTPDGSIPPSGAPIDTTADPDLLSDSRERRPSVVPAEPLAKGDRNCALRTETSTDSIILDSKGRVEATRIPEHEVVPEQEEVPEGINTDVFYSPRVAKLLRGTTTKDMQRPDLEVAGAKQLDGVKPASTEKMGQDIFNERDTSAKQTLQPDAQTTQNEHFRQGRADDIDIHELGAALAKDSHTMSPAQAALHPVSGKSSYQMRESRVPSSRFGRFWQYGGLATSMAFGAVGESFRRATGSGTTGSVMLSAANMERLVAKLSRMRGAALKLGQMMSFQDSKMLPAPIAEVLKRVQDHADYMPASQRNQVLVEDLGSEWRSLFSSFDEIPMAAASIGQVHQAVLASNNQRVAVKIQYPGVAKSISSDLSNLSILLTASRLLPKGLYLDKTIANARTELAWECDYEREAQCQTRFRDLLAHETEVFTVPKVFLEACGRQVLTAELMHGRGVTTSALRLTQTQKDWIGTHIMRLSLMELMDFKFMQTDPNWTNFLFNADSNKLELLDFGAAREFPDKFVDPYVSLLIAATKNDREIVRERSIELGYLTGHESQTMLDAHIGSVMTLAEPFALTASEGEMYAFKDQTVTDRVREFIPVMIRERLAPPPEETYSLHRKLSGAFLLLARLGSRVRCRELFLDAVKDWKRKRGGVSA